MYNTYDGLGKNALTSFLKSRGHQVPDNQREAFASYDLVSLLNDQSLFHEVEVCPTWITHFPYHTRSVPYRKYTSLADFYYMVNHDGTKIAVTEMDNIKRSPVIRKNTTRSTDEQFFNVSLQFFRFYELKNDTWTNYTH